MMQEFIEVKLLYEDQRTITTQRGNCKCSYVCKVYVCVSRWVSLRSTPTAPLASTLTCCVSITFVIIFYNFFSSFDKLNIARLSLAVWLMRKAFLANTIYRLIFDKTMDGCIIIGLCNVWDLTFVSLGVRGFVCRKMTNE